MNTPVSRPRERIQATPAPDQPMRLPRGATAGPLGLLVHPASGKPGKLLPKEGHLILVWAGHAVFCPCDLVGEAIALGYLPPSCPKPAPTHGDIRLALRRLHDALPMPGQGEEEARFCRGVLANVMDGLPP